MGRPTEEYWRSLKRADVGARLLLGDTYEILAWAHRRSKASLRSRLEDRKELQQIAGMRGRVERALKMLASMERDVESITLTFPHAPDVMEAVTRTLRVTNTAGQELLDATSRAKQMVEAKFLGYQGRYPARFVQVDFISYALGTIHFAYRNTRPTNPDPLHPDRVEQQRLVDEAGRGVLLKPSGWALAAIALGIDKPCADSAEFWERVTNRWAGPIGTVLQQLREHGIVEEDGRARFQGASPVPQNVPPRMSSSSSSRPVRHEGRAHRGTKKRRAAPAPRR